VVVRPWPRGEKRRGGRESHHETFEAIGAFLLLCAATGVSLLAVWGLSGATPRGQPWTPAVTLLHGYDGLSARRMAVLWTFREPSLCRHVRREFMRNALLDFTPIIAATACHQINYLETYSRFMRRRGMITVTRNRRDASGSGPSRPWNAWALRSPSNGPRHHQARVSSLLRLS
jgi:hypothetical protein